MTINALRGRSSGGDARPESLAIGEVDANIVDCPVCKRPLDSRARRCSGCRTLLVHGVQGSKAGMFVVFGLAIGLLTGAGVIGVAMSQPRVATPTTLPASVTPVTPTTAPVSSVDPGGIIPLVPVAATAALKGTAAVNARIAATAQPLAAEVAAADFDSQAVAQILRRLGFEAGAAQSLLPALDSWDQASAIHLQLEGFYTDLRSTTRDALAASIRNDEAYKAAATDVLAQLTKLPSIDRSSRDLARTADVELPAVALTP
jgi:hypothetical protein